MPISLLSPSLLTAYALRLRPGDDLRQQLTTTVRALGMQAGAVLTCVGSLTTVVLRLANQDVATTYHGHFEIVSLVGTLAESGSHLHLAVADSTGRMIGGHLLDGNIIYTTAELVLGVLPALVFRREPDVISSYHELAIYPAGAAPENP
ncbi:PPC domain-containing DNA-binding protein [Hymenobacter defluvii]|uniref:DNA-binding protein n=1 Tax=Hymenobacter defluvii TaxID=2054411 RepID=A0ABS3TGX7_9BACT|nr:PPC domain-containing DNA-binding protein [Hymenobacter defluvii]MBO3272916.1 DNA-binding protein [Hymenobacter defluvii]